jgi:glyoxylase-like metal-dependent hydrolase (beta-lactamase superfamily II)
MVDYEILIQGYAKEINDYQIASSAVVLLKENSKKIIVDPGTNRKLLLDELKKRSIKTKDIDYVVLTHSHADHALLAGIFENAQVVDDGCVYSWNGKIENHDGFIPQTDIKIMKTKGHDEFHCSLLFENENDGMVCVSGDVFWWWDSEDQNLDRKSLLERKDPYEKNHDELIESRRILLDVADLIIPGHGKMFKVKK